MAHAPVPLLAIALTLGGSALRLSAAPTAELTIDRVMDSGQVSGRELAELGVGIRGGPHLAGLRLELHVAFDQGVRCRAECRG